MSFPISAQPLSLARTLDSAQPLVQGQVGELHGHALAQVHCTPPSIPYPGDLPPAVNAEPTPFTAQLSGRMQQVLGEMAGAASSSLADSALGETTRNLHDRVPRLMSSASLVDNVGHKPKSDLLFGLIGMSTHYKAVLGGLDAYQAKLITPIGMDTASAREYAAGLAKDLTAIYQKAEQYIEQHQGTPSKGTAVAAMREMQSQVMNEMALVNRVATSLVDNAGVRGMTWKDSMAGAGYRLLDSVARYNDTNLAHANDSFGGGQVNQVAKLTYRTPEGGLETRIFKADPQKLDAYSGSPVQNENAQALISQIFVPSGIDPERPAFAARNVAMAFVNEALGLNNLVHCSFAVHNDAIGMAMDEAPGRTSKYNVKQAVPDYILSELGDAADLVVSGKAGTRQDRIEGMVAEMSESYVVAWNNPEYAG